MKAKGCLEEDQRAVFGDKSWLDILRSPDGVVEVNFVKTVQVVAEELKAQIASKRHLNYDLPVFLEELSTKLADSIKVQFTELHITGQVPLIVQEVAEDLKVIPNEEEKSLAEPEDIEKSLLEAEDQKKEEEEEGEEEEKKEEIQEKEDFSEDEELIEVVSNLFRRILKIFCANNRTLQDLFESIDVNKDGKITELEMRLELLKHDPNITQDECKAVFSILDGNKDGSLSLDELQKRIKLLQEKAEAEERDPLAHMVFSNPLNPSLLHGNLTVILTKASNLKPGTHSVKIRLKDSLEYTTNDTLEINPNWNFRCDFIFENKTKAQLPSFIEFDLLNKGKIEGSGTFQWIKAMDKPNEFSLKIKTDIKTSTGQIRGSLYFSVKWTPIIPRILNEDEEKRLMLLRITSEEHKKTSATLEKLETQEHHIAHEVNETDSPLFSYESINDTSNPVVSKPGDFVYVIEKTVKVVERTYSNSGLSAPTKSVDRKPSPSTKSKPAN